MTSEFDIISKYFAPLAAKSALGLKDDAAFLTPPPGCDLVLTKDALVEGVHFRSEDAPELIAKKLGRVNLSDLAAKGAKPLGFLLATAFPSVMTEDWIAGFAEGLRADQEVFGWELLGGDTVSTPGPLTLSLTAIGSVPKGQMLLRSGASAGDLLFVTGTIGDSYLGLEALESGLPGDHSGQLAERYLCPNPRVGVGQALHGVASACVDVSDGLVADLEHLAEASGLKAELELGKVPLSVAAGELVAEGRVLRTELITGGDDYELCFAAPSSARESLAAISTPEGVEITEIGRLASGSGVQVLNDEGAIVPIKSKGYDHFSE